MIKDYDPDIHPLEHFCRDLEDGTTKILTKHGNENFLKDTGEEYMEMKKTEKLRGLIRELLEETGIL